MRVSIINCVSTAYHMMKYSDDSLLRRAGHDRFDYIVVRWLASEPVNQYLARLPDIVHEQYPGAAVHIVDYHTNPDIGYVPNLRGMMNVGFDYGFNLNDYAGLINTDCYFGPDWLGGLVRHSHHDRVINSLHITRATPPRPAAGIITKDLGEPLHGIFKLQEFIQLYDRLYDANHLLLASNIGDGTDYRQCATMPYLFHRKYWEECGPWECTCKDGQPPDVRFFDRIHNTGAAFAITHSSIVYHHEAVERRGSRPPGAEHLEEE